MSIIIVTETDLPQLTVTIPENLQIQKVNLNDDIQIDINYEENPDDAFINLILFYKLEIIKTKSYNYISFKFKIWDLFNDFDLD